MKRNFIILAASLLTISSTFAAKPIINTDHHNFNPVAWHATMQNGGFTYQNITQKTQYVQVAIDTGSIGIFKLSNGQINGCVVNLDANSYTHSTVCELLPNEILSGDYDFLAGIESSGTYQVEMGK
jgi:hypothetical protein